jgi:hypothetical protein
MIRIIYDQALPLCFKFYTLSKIKIKQYLDFKMFTGRAPVGLMPVILATQEAEIRRMEDQSQPGQNSSQDSISKKNHKKGLVE